MSIDWIVNHSTEHLEIFLTDCLDYTIYFDYWYNYWDINQDISPDLLKQFHYQRKRD